MDPRTRPKPGVPLTELSNLAGPSSVHRVASDGNIGDSLPVARTIRIKGTDVSLSSLNPFQRKEAVGKLGNVVRCDLLKEGVVEVEFADKREAERALETTNLVYKVKEGDLKRNKSIPVLVQVPPVSTLCRGIITCGDLNDMSDQDITDELADAGVTAARRLGKTDTIVLSFSVDGLPERIFIGFRSVPVRPYVPEPLRCYKCHMFGHVSTKCNRGVRCGRCGDGKHDSNHCSAASPKCPNCRGEHPAWSRGCDEYKKEKEIGRIRLRQGVSFQEARRLYSEEHPNPSSSVRNNIARQSRAPNTSPTLGSAPGNTHTSLTLNTKIGDLLNLTLGELLQLLLNVIPATLQTSPCAPVQTEAPPQTGPTNRSAQQTAGVPTGAAAASGGPSAGESISNEFTMIGKSGKPVGTRRGGPAPSNEELPRSPPPLPPVPSRETAGSVSVVSRPPPPVRPGSTMPPPRPPPPLPPTKVTRSPAGRPSHVSPSGRASQTPPSQRRHPSSPSPSPSESPARGRGDKRPLRESVSPVEREGRQRVRVEPPAFLDPERRPGT